jgi:hypothetical protein
MGTGRSLGSGEAGLEVLEEVESRKVDRFVKPSPVQGGSNEDFKFDGRLWCVAIGQRVVGAHEQMTYRQNC